MADTIRTLSDLLTHLPLNAAGLIKPQDVRDMAVSAMPTGRFADKIVASNDASNLWKAQADYVCDGADDDVQIRAAIDALPTSGLYGGGTVMLSPGMFGMGSGGLNMSACARKEFVRVVGQGPYATILNGPTGVPTLQIGTGTLYSQDFIDIENLGIMCDDRASNTIGILLTGCRNVGLKNIYVNWGWAGVRMTKAEWVSMQHVVVQNCTQYGLDVVIDSNADGHFHADCCQFQMPAGVLAGGSAAHLIGGASPNPWYEALFSRCQFYISPGASGAGARCFYQEGRFGSIHQATRNMTFNECQFENEGNATDNIGVDLETCNHITFIGPTFSSGGAMKHAIRTANDPGVYILLNAYFNTQAPTGGYHLYNSVGDFYLLGYTWDNLRNHFLTPATVHQMGFTLTKAGAVSDADFGDGIFPMSGLMGVDTTNHRLYVRDGSTWRYAGLT